MLLLLGSLDLRGYAYVSVHAPTNLEQIKESEAVRMLEAHD